MSARQPLFLFALLAIVGGSTPAGAQAVYGYVDLHSHLMAEHSFGGGWFAGTLEGPMDVAVQRCDGNFPNKSHAATRFPVGVEVVAVGVRHRLGEDGELRAGGHVEGLGSGHGPGPVGALGERHLQAPGVGGGDEQDGAKKRGQETKRAVHGILS